VEPQRPKLLVDTNIILDVVLKRGPWVDDSARVLDAIATGRASGFVAAHAITALHYIVARANGRVAANLAVSDLLQICEVVPLGSHDFQRAVALELKDFEDAVHVAAAIAAGSDYIVSRNEADFKGSPIAVRAPAVLIPLLQ
jgi:predicted nucleic acid-binding protein